MDLQKLISTLHPLERTVLIHLDKFSSFEDIVKITKLKEVEVMRALQWLQNKKVIAIKENVKEIVQLDKNGEIYFKEGLPERRFILALKNKELTLSQLIKKANLKKDEVNVSLGLLKKKAAVMVLPGKEIKVKLSDYGESLLKKELLEEQFLNKSFPVDVKDLKSEEQFALKELKKRRSIIKVDLIKKKFVELTELGKTLVKLDMKQGDVIERLTPKVIKSGLWKKKKFRAYDVSVNVPKIYPAKRHFVNQAVNYIKQIWLDLGFKEMTGSLVQTAFWDMDALFVPQDHPARDMQDTFYLSDPKYGRFSKEFYSKIKDVHENGGKTGSLGWQCKFDEEKAKELLLRTHTTVLSAQTIAALKKDDLPAKFFSVAKVFRNETLSWKHLFEFYQVEGIVIDPNANFQHLKGYLREFYKKMGYPDVRLRPAHFPYTEPSVEVEVLHPVKNEWVELGGAGIFRPEVVVPLLGYDVPVLAWGQGMERIIAEYYKITDIRDLYRNDLKQLREMRIWNK